MKITADSSVNIDRLAHTAFAAVPLRITVGDTEFADTPGLRVEELLGALDESRGPSSTACPGIGDWLDAYGGAEEVLALSLTGKLSGCCRVAMIAAQEYMDTHPGSRVCVLDTLTTGPEMELLAERADELNAAGMGLEEIYAELAAYRERTALGFMLGSLDNFARNGRVSPALAKLVKMLKVRIVGRASDDGDLEPLNKCRGERRAMEQLWRNMQAAGYRGGKVRIRHTGNPEAARTLERMILTEHPAARMANAKSATKRRAAWLAGFGFRYFFSIFISRFHLNIYTTLIRTA